MDSVRTKIRKAIFQGLSSISTTGGYAISILDSYDTERSIEQMINLPAVNVTFGRESYLNATGGATAMGYLVKQLPVSLDVFVSDINNVSESEHRCLSAIERYFLNNRCLPLDSEHTLVGTLTVSTSEVRGIESVEPRGYISVNLDIVYHQNILDPYSVEPSEVTPVFIALPPVSSPVSRKYSLHQALIRNINTINGLYCLGSVQSVEQMTRFPHVNLRIVEERSWDADTPMYQDRVNRKHLIYRMDCFLSVVNDLRFVKEDVLARVEQHFMNYFTIPDENGRRTCTECMFLSNQEFGTLSTKVLGGVSIELKCFYRQELHDPAQITVP